MFFFLELATYVAVIYWALTRELHLALRIGLAVAGVAIMVTVWSLLGAPTATYHLEGWNRAALLVVWFGAGVAALLASGRHWMALVLAVLATISAGLAFAWQQ
jgi:hypothetical protein